jgi:hypothetical protein
MDAELTVMGLVLLELKDILNRLSLWAGNIAGDTRLALETRL